MFALLAGFTQISVVLIDNLYNTRKSYTTKSYTTVKRGC